MWDPIETTQTQEDLVYAWSSLDCSSPKVHCSGNDVVALILNYYNGIPDLPDSLSALTALTQM